MLVAAWRVKGALGQQLAGMNEVRVTTGGASHFLIEVQKVSRPDPKFTVRRIVGLDPSQPGAQGTLLRVLEAYQGVAMGGDAAPGPEDYPALLPLLKAGGGGRGLYASWRKSRSCEWTPWAPLPLNV